MCLEFGYCDLPWADGAVHDDDGVTGQRGAEEVESERLGWQRDRQRLVAWGVVSVELEDQQTAADSFGAAGVDERAKCSSPPLAGVRVREFRVEPVVGNVAGFANEVVPVESADIAPGEASASPGPTLGFICSMTTGASHRPSQGSGGSSVASRTLGSG